MYLYQTIIFLNLSHQINNVFTGFRQNYRKWQICDGAKKKSHVRSQRFGPNSGKTYELLLHEEVEIVQTQMNIFMSFIEEDTAVGSRYPEFQGYLYPEFKCISG